MCLYIHCEGSLYLMSLESCLVMASYVIVTVVAGTKLPVHSVILAHLHSAHLLLERAGASKCSGAPAQACVPGLSSAAPRMVRPHGLKPNIVPCRWDPESPLCCATEARNGGCSVGHDRPHPGHRHHHDIKARERRSDEDGNV